MMMFRGLEVETDELIYGSLLDIDYPNHKMFIVPCMGRPNYININPHTIEVQINNDAEWIAYSELDKYVLIRKNDVK